MAWNPSRRVWGRLRWLAHWRCKEPVVVLESDDWGMQRTACPDDVARYGAPSEWAYESSETAEDLQSLYRVLESHRDRYGNPACLTANFIVCNPDYDAIEASGYDEYRDHPLDHTADADVLAGYREGMERGVLDPAYHGRRHLCPTPWLEDLRQDVPGARALFALRRGGGITLCEGQGWRYHSEYIDWRRGRFLTAAEVGTFLEPGVAVFRRIFGRDSASTIPPHYLFGGGTCKAWVQARIGCVQGAGYRLSAGAGGETLVWSHYLGEAGPAGLVYLNRTVRLEPRPSRPRSGLASAANAMREMFAGKVPVVVDTHRINYTGGFRRQALAELDGMLAEAERAGAVFLSTAELAEAIRGAGRYHDRRSGETRRLTPISTRWTASARSLLALRQAPERNIEQQ